MYRVILIPSVALILAAAAALDRRVDAQPATQKTEEELHAAWEAHHRDFDYLLGDWEFDAENGDYGKFSGVWSALRLPGGQILDEYRVVGDSGETYYVTTTIRSYNAALDRWELVGMDQGNGLQDTGTARREGNEVHIEQRFGSSIWRIRYYDIRDTEFSWAADRSLDGGTTWQREYMRLEARRRGPERRMERLTPSR